MDYLSLIRLPIEKELADFIQVFNESLSHTEGLLDVALSHIRQRGGKRMRPLMVLLMSKNFGQISSVSLDAAAGLELLHTASLVHDDVVDESEERRGQASVNASYDNKVAVLVGDYLLSTALLRVSLTHNQQIVQIISELGRTLAAGEILQLTNTGSEDFSEEVYYNIIQSKTAALFEACARVGALAGGATDEEVEAAAQFGNLVGMIFQIRDDIFDYFSSSDIGKPTGNDMKEGKLTLPLIYALNSTGNEEMKQLALKVRKGTVGAEDIARLVAFTKDNGGIDYAEKRMEELAEKARHFISVRVKEKAVKEALTAYVSYVIQRTY